MTGYSRDELEGVCASITGGGYTPLATAVAASEGDLNAAQGNKALIVISDGLETDFSSVANAQALKKTFGDGLCIYTIAVGKDAGGVQLLQKIAGAGGCGFSVNAADVASPEGMARFVFDVFLARGKTAPSDSDGDGVPDDMDKCPGTPAGVKVDQSGCPLDTDGDGVPDFQDKCPGTPGGVKVDATGCPLDTDEDGVPDYLDKCPNTPKGAKVDARGCWAYQGSVLFELNKAELRPQSFPTLNNGAEVLKRNPGLKVEIQGYTCDLGTEEHNLKLSEKRASAVYDYLLKMGVSESQISYRGLGEASPAYPNDSDENRRLNRRVGFKVME